ncbi:hypothetical protein PVNG_04763 [Plasmodium vivax North Korean]|uniref:VIR protein n=1 Tax=Plasmodium vivax North Korean TaxID=1035514 RepID=A0A0J9TXU1_PLAVI|nr:hypothetical protein PVNG_04763 [Plasmodium vivax North Korean]
MAKTNEQQLEETINDLKLDKIYKDFFASDGKSKNFDSKCNVFNEKGKEKPEAPKLCSSLVYYLEKIREMSSKQDSNKYCGYLPYWLYDKIGKIHSPLTTKIDKVPFYADLIKAGNAISGAHLKQLCTIPTLKDVDLNELKKRKISYIYFKNLENIYNVSISKKEADCAKYLTYLENFKSLYEAYKSAHCSYFFFAPTGPDFFPCTNKYDLKYLMSGLKNCKERKDPYPKPPVVVTSRTVRSGSGTTAGQTGLKGSPGSSNKFSRSTTSKTRSINYT